MVNDMSEYAKTLKGRASFTSSPLWDHDVTWGGSAPVGLLALGALASRAGVQTTGSTIGGDDPVRWTGTRAQFIASDLFDQVRFPMRAGQARTKEGLIGRIRVVGDRFELVVTGYAMPRSPQPVSSLFRRARADLAFQQFVARAQRVGRGRRTMTRSKPKGKAAAPVSPAVNQQPPIEAVYETTPADRVSEGMSWTNTVLRAARNGDRQAIRDTLLMVAGEIRAGRR